MAFLVPQVDTDGCLRRCSGRFVHGFSLALSGGFAILFQGSSPFCPWECGDWIETTHETSIIDQPSHPISEPNTMQGNSTDKIGELSNAYGHWRRWKGDTRRIDARRLRDRRV